MALLGGRYAITTYLHYENAIRALNCPNAFELVIANYGSRFDGNGPKMAEEMHKNFPNIPLIIVSGNQNESEIIQVCNPDACISTPFIPTEILMDTVNNCLEQKARKTLVV